MGMNFKDHPVHCGVIYFIIFSLAVLIKCMCISKQNISAYNTRLMKTVDESNKVTYEVRLASAQETSSGKLVMVFCHSCLSFIPTYLKSHFICFL